MLSPHCLNNKYMCGILAILFIKGNESEIRTLAYNLSKRQRHRGPDRSRIIIIVKIFSKIL